MMTTNEIQKLRLELVQELLIELSNDWNEEDVLEYPAELQSFDEEVHKLLGIRFGKELVA